MGESLGKIMVNCWRNKDLFSSAHTVMAAKWYVLL